MTRLVISGIQHTSELALGFYISSLNHGRSHNFWDKTNTREKENERELKGAPHVLLYNTKNGTSWNLSYTNSLADTILEKNKYNNGNESPFPWSALPKHGYQNSNIKQVIHHLALTYEFLKMIVSSGEEIRLIEWFALKGLKLITIKWFAETAFVLRIFIYIVWNEKKVS